MIIMFFVIVIFAIFVLPKIFKANQVKSME